MNNMSEGSEGEIWRCVYQVDFSELFSRVPLAYNCVVKPDARVWMRMIFDYRLP
jgi:hypothetical protein